ncbi:MAG: chemotaxis protein CheD [Phycisphaerae bacterium]|nr:chemotaxis protein CheD [Phycisphaerae bacterium]
MIAAGGTHCTFCLADEALEKQQAVNNRQIRACGRIWDAHWIALDDQTSYNAYTFYDIGSKGKREKVWGLGMEDIIDVQIGQVKAGTGAIVLETRAIGSCIAIAAYDAGKKAGALAHVMLSGKAPVGSKESEKMRYVVDAIEAIVDRMGDLGSKAGEIVVVVAGGGNMLDREDDAICRDNIESVLELLEKNGLRVAAQALGGTDRRSVFLDVGRGVIFCVEGDGPKIELWRA